MRFMLIDRITELQPGASITAVKSLLPTEEYLIDHFPRFPVMPGVLMLEVMYEASAWLVRVSEDYHHAVILLKEARNVKYADFVEPGETLVVKSAIVKQEGSLTTLKSQGLVGDVLAVSGTLVLERFHVADVHPQRAAWDAYARKKYRREFESLFQPPTRPDTRALADHVA
jgi:3-hydroxyacyl-[acyl-carrier-protein] dehydratase